MTCVMPVAYGTEAYCFEDFREWVIEQYEKPQLVCIREDSRYTISDRKAALEHYYNYFKDDLEILSQSPNANKLQHYPYVNYRNWSKSNTVWFHSRCEKSIRKRIPLLSTIYCDVTYGSIKKALTKTDHLYELWNGFEEWFEKWRQRIMADAKNEIEKKKAQAVKIETGMKLRTGSVGGTANLLKVLTKTMEQQGADIRSIAKMQWQVCLQMGIILPDEFLRDVAVALTIEEKF